MDMKTQEKCRGFALVIALSLMAFVLLLLLSISALIQVDTQSAQVSLTRVEAEQNALLGLQQALGELQVAMGPDQRVSATADIFPGGVTAASRRNTVGVWASADADNLGIAKGDLITWLASDARLADGTLVEDYYRSGIGALVRPVTLVGAGSLDGDGDGRADDPDDEIIVDAALSSVEREGNVVGRYAWWVGDEGVKARVNLSRAEPSAGAAKHRAVLEAGSSSIANAGVLAELSEIDFETDGGRITDLNAIDLLDGSTDEVANAYFHDLTAHSAGVLADVKNGGLKKDLSLAFEMEDRDFNRSEFGSGGPRTINAPGFGRVQPVFRAGTAHGPVWHLLRDYYRLYHEMENPMTDPTIDARVFGPNLNHGSMPGPDSLSGSSWSLDQQPAALFAGGKTKFHFQIVDERSPFYESGIPKDIDTDPNTMTAPLDMAMINSDPIRLDTAGDPLRGGGQSAGGTTMPVMVTGNYLPYMQRFVMEVGFWFERRAFPMQTNRYRGQPFDVITARQQRYENPVAIYQVNRQRFIMHNPYNVTLRHDEIGLDSTGCENSVAITEDATNQAIFLILGENFPFTYRRPKQYWSSRQVRIASGKFDPGELKTFNAALHSRSGAVPYATEGTDPVWDTTYAVNGDIITTFIEAPDSPAVNPTQVPYTMHLSAENIGTTEQIQSPGNNNSPGTWGHETGYSFAQFSFLTHLKQPGNQSFGGNAIADRWPMASIIDTGLLFPGPDYSAQGSESVFTRGKPGMFSHYFPNGGNTLALTPEVIDDYNDPQNPYVMATFDLQLKPTEFDRSETRYPAFTRSNPLAPVRDNKNLLPADDLVENSVGFPGISPDLDLTLSDDGTGGFTSNLDYWGPSDGSIEDTASGVRDPVLIELPTTPVLSIGKLQHANISVHAHMPALAIGNSLASPYIDPTRTIAQFGNRYKQPRAFYDLSYHMNDALWDSYFFSSYSLPYDAGRDAYGTDVVDVFDDLASGATPLPNSRMTLSTIAAESVGDIRGKLFEDSGDIREEAYNRAAENLLVAGSFNVNSTSVEAWRAVLSGARDFAVYPSGEGDSEAPSPRSTPFPRISQPVEGESDGGDSGDDETWSGFRSLSEAEISDLATAIVAELRARIATRGQPYLSLSDFVNRELTAAASGRAGLLQAAIDNANLNDGLKGSRDDVNENSLENGDNGQFPFAANILEADGDDSSANQAAPAYLMQADILQAIGSFISVRSDTFRIRSYGEGTDPITGKVRSQVWMEAIVQRLPEPVRPDPGTTPDEIDYWDVADAGGNPLPFGRGFKVVSMRQLAEEDV